ncbi:MAG TPA: methionine--tRNA ligase [Longimicrobiales bacterium]|nr:methionine--tRNA ligase [Longimicrobiales bacterium]
MSDARVFYLTTAIDYANGLPHLGHALEKIGADAIARYHRLKGEDVHFVLGMDEHGQNIVQSAEQAGLDPRAWVDRIGAAFRAAWAALLVSQDDFIRTTEHRHHVAVHDLIRRIGEAGDLYRGTYEGWYCVRCEAFKTEDDLEGEGDDLRCPLHPSRQIQWTVEENWFFRLSAYRDRLLALLVEHPEFVQPEIRRNEIFRVLEHGLQDLSVSRALPWGVPWPGADGEVVYVWIDALTNYLSATGYPAEGFERLWPADVHVIGKDITRFHCIYWPAFLMSAGLPLPATVWAHGFVGYGGRRLSKSEGVSFGLDEAIARHGPEALRYYLLREVPWDGDGDVTRERFDERYTAELANDIGNLVNRSLSMVERYRDGVVPEGDATELDARARELIDAYRRAMDAYLLHEGLQAAFDLASAANGFVTSSEPWALAKDPDRSRQLDAVLHALARAIATLATMLAPFMPEKMTSLANRLGLPGVPSLTELERLKLNGKKVERGDILFPRPD